MTLTKETPWQDCTDPVEMLVFLQAQMLRQGTPERVLSLDRRLRLWCAACCRLCWDHLTDHEKECVEAAELLADGMLTQQQARLTRQEAHRHLGGYPSIHLAAAECLTPWTLDASRRVQQLTLTRDGISLMQQVGLLREIFDQVACLAAGESSCVAFLLTADVQSLAVTAYANQESDGRLSAESLGILRDCLQDNESDDSVLLAHLQTPDHYRGCWAVDLLRGVP